MLTTKAWTYCSYCHLIWLFLKYSNWYWVSAIVRFVRSISKSSSTRRPCSMSITCRLKVSYAPIACGAWCKFGLYLAKTHAPKICTPLDAQPSSCITHLYFTYLCVITQHRLWCRKTKWMKTEIGRATYTHSPRLLNCSIHLWLLCNFILCMMPWIQSLPSFKNFTYLSQTLGIIQMTG